MSKFTDVQVATMIDVYKKVDTEEYRTTIVAAIAESMEVSPKSIIGKLVSERVYIKKTPVVASTVAKEEYATAIRIMIGARDTELPSLKNMTVKDLIIFSELLIRVSDRSAA